MLICFQKKRDECCVFVLCDGLYLFEWETVGSMPVHATGITIGCCSLLRAFFFLRRKRRQERERRKYGKTANGLWVDLDLLHGSSLSLFVCVFCVCMCLNF